MRRVCLSVLSTGALLGGCVAAPGPAQYAYTPSYTPAQSVAPPYALQPAAGAPPAYAPPAGRQPDDQQSVYQQPAYQTPDYQQQPAYQPPDDQAPVYQGYPGPAPGQAYTGPDGLTYVDGYPVDTVDGYQAAFVFAPALGGWGYYDGGHRWHGAPPGYRDRLEQFHPGGRGLPPGGPRFGGPGFDRPGFDRPAFARPGYGGPGPGFGERRPEGRPGFTGGPPGRPFNGGPGFNGGPPGRPIPAGGPPPGRPPEGQRPPPGGPGRPPGPQ